jgi:hypothetical protein
MSHATNDLLPSLTGGSDLFLQEPAAANHTTSTNPTTSKLMQSGLLGDVSAGDGLFDAVDAQQQQEEEQKRVQQQQEEAARQQQQEEAARQQAELQQQQQLNQQQQMNQQLMESVSLGDGEAYPFVMTQQQPAYPQQQHPVYATPPRMTQQGMPVQQQQQPTMPPLPQQSGMSTMGMPPQQPSYPMNAQPQQQTSNQLMSQSMMMPPSQPNMNNQMMNQSMMLRPASSYQPHPNPNHMMINHPSQQPHLMMNHPSMNHPPQQQHMTMNHASSSTTTMNQNASYGPPHPPATNSYGPPLGNPMAGMHNIHPQQGLPPQMRSYPVPAAPTHYGTVTVDQPLLLTGKGSLFVKSTPFWSYQIATQVPPHVWVVRRRFRDVVALEDRLRQDCPGCILPPR